MFDKNWKPTLTYPERYEEIGVVDHVLEYLRASNKRDIVIVDIGCSTAVATKQLKNMLDNSGIKNRTIGIDLSQTVREEAMQNVDLFLNQDVMYVDSTLYPADIVICCNMIFYLNHLKKAEVISKCSQFMKDDSVLITNTPLFEQPSDYAQLKLFLRDYVPVMLTIFYNPKRFYGRYKETESIRVKRRMFSFHGKNEAVAYAGRIITSWENLPLGQKFGWYIEMARAQFLTKVRRLKPRSKKRKF
ncbi:hypothetical protein Ngar_c29080 [Candidatus Nitrososphaera gargensis Ga9.2]|uniref:Methyltransferase domain-containing protein n=1 Tax=Nitrososphaera gargensis (strain Ga9.2) TaxID=1237085 RepID=K0ILZ5_NITGG|nr:class I SAM-dependent methyltransferase [Candidatus Nitrososphaera gargensis]AFU59827.1 hypothetical protein Ngar_c29080 [Candidatus Nitrososphaera gargensis Ga9.2]